MKPGLLPREVRSVSEVFRVKGTDVHIIIGTVVDRDRNVRMRLLIGPTDGKDGDLVARLNKEIPLAMHAAPSRQ